MRTGNPFRRWLPLFLLNLLSLSGGFVRLTPISVPRLCDALATLAWQHTSVASRSLPLRWILRAVLSAGSEANVSPRVRPELPHPPPPTPPRWLLSSPFELFRASQSSPHAGLASLRRLFLPNFPDSPHENSLPSGAQQWANSDTQLLAVPAAPSPKRSDYSFLVFSCSLETGRLPFLYSKVVQPSPGLLFLDRTAGPARAFHG